MTQRSATGFRIRAAEEGDSTQIGLLAGQFADYLRGLGDQTDFNFNAEAYLRDGFGSDPAFEGIVASRDDTILGYLLYCPGYDTDRGVRLLHVLDLYVRDDARRQGVGRALMLEAASICRLRGSRELVWSVYEPNKLAVEFYEGLGARHVVGLALMTLPV